jgi:hypothetical protein
MKQYRIFYRRAGAEKWGNLQPAVHAALAAIRQHPEIEAVCVRNDDALLNIVVSDQEALAPNAFILETGVPQ